MFDGQLIPVPDMPRSYVPTLFASAVPELMLALGLCRNRRRAGRRAAGRRSRHRRVGRRAALLRVVLAATLPILITVAARPAMYNGIRHFVFVLPPFAVLGGLAAPGSRARLAALRHGAVAAGALALIAGIASPVVDMVRLHPYQYTDYNHIAGGVARRAEELHARLLGAVADPGLAAIARLHRANATRRRRTDTWTVAVCGPHPPVAVALGPQFTTTWNPKGADFAMMLGVFYCAKLDAPELFEIVRDGVVYARVYDIRGRTFTSLLTVPGSINNTHDGRNGDQADGTELTM